VSKPPPNNNDKTVIIRPNPGGRRDAAPQAPSPPPPAGADIWGNEEPQTPARAPRVAHPQAPNYYQPPPAYPPQQQYQPYQPQPAYPPQQQNYYQPAPDAAAPRQPQAGPPLDLGLERHPDVAGPNPILNAARPLLILLANLRLTSDHSQAAPLMDAVAEQIASIDRDLAQAGVSPEHLRMTKYAVCATTDDIVQNLPGSDRLLWTQYSMMARFFGQAVSGIGFFDELNRAKAQPTANYDVLELMHACLSLGFQGQFRSGGGGDVMLQQIRRDLYQTLRTFKPRAGEDISPHWKGQDIKPKHMQVRLPVWVTAAGAGVLLLGVFIGLRLLLGLSSDALADKMAGIHPTTEIRLARDAPKPPPAPPPGESKQLVRVRTALQQEISGKKLEVFESRGQIVVKLLTDALFAPGSADVNPDFVPALDKVASVLDTEPKTISVVGHTDNVKLKSRLKFKNNQDLSEKRAIAVAKIMAPKLTDPARIETSGLGETTPIKDNKTKEGRAANRRVEIFLPRTGP
jgi:type VI secretion system protein ImpK